MGYLVPYKNIRNSQVRLLTIKNLHWSVGQIPGSGLLVSSVLGLPQHFSTGVRRNHKQESNFGAECRTRHSALNLVGNFLDLLLQWHSMARLNLLIMSCSSCWNENSTDLKCTANISVVLLITFSYGQTKFNFCNTKFQLKCLSNFLKLWR